MLYILPEPKHSLRRIFSVWRRYQKVYFKFFLANVLPPFLEPLMVILALGVGLAAYMKLVDGVSYAAFLAPGMIAASVMWSASFETTYGTFIRMEYERIYEAILASPVSFVEMVLGELLWVASKCSIFSLGVLIVVSSFGLISSWWAFLAIPLGFTGGVVFALLGILVTSKVREINNFNFYITGVMTPMFFFSGAFFPLSELPGPLYKFALMMPMTHLVALMRACCMGRFHPGLLLNMAVLVVFCMVLWPLSVAMLRRRIVV
ncbi:MAG: ABC transporter permease [Gemmatimonadota bacterium]|nr:ABC transporter permease [Gemmatimonadota bacterium]